KARENTPERGHARIVCANRSIEPEEVVQFRSGERTTECALAERRDEAAHACVAGARRIARNELAQVRPSRNPIGRCEVLRDQVWAYRERLGIVVEAECPWIRRKLVRRRVLVPHEVTDRVVVLDAIQSPYDRRPARRGSRSRRGVVWIGLRGNTPR